MPGLPDGRARRAHAVIHYVLRCAAGHDFDGWFRGSASFDQQARAGLLACPTCASTEVSRGLMAPLVADGGRPAPVTKAAQDSPPARRMPDEMRAALQRIRAEVERTCVDVGAGFAEAARAMHEGTRAVLPIYGETTPEEARGLAEDGIEVSRIPWVPRAEG